MILYERNYKIIGQMHAVFRHPPSRGLDTNLMLAIVMSGTNYQLASCKKFPILKKKLYPDYNYITSAINKYMYRMTIKMLDSTIFGMEYFVLWTTIGIDFTLYYSVYIQRCFSRHISCYKTRNIGQTNCALFLLYW